MNYGTTDVVVDIRAENLGQRIDSGGDTMDDASILERLSEIEMERPVNLVILHDSNAVRIILDRLFHTCEEKSQPFPRLFADRHTMGMIRPALPEGATINAFGEKIDSDLVFLAEMEMDGLFGYETVATRLLRQFGEEEMLSAYSARSGNLPAPGRLTKCMDVARGFADGFEIRGIEIVANSRGITDIAVGHPSKTLSLSESFRSSAKYAAERRRSFIVSTGKSASNHTLNRALGSVWNCAAAVSRGGLIILLAESQLGLGSEAARMLIEGRLNPEDAGSSVRYVDGMENLLFLTSCRSLFQVGLVSLLPASYTKRLGLIPFNSTKHALGHIFKAQGARQKISLVMDGARVSLE